MFILQVSLVVNVASECGYTDMNYKQLVSLQDLYNFRHFTVLAFPCNQFGEQEPNSNEAIWNFAYNNYAVNFPMFGKVDVKGDKTCQVYKFLTETTGSTPSWNFCKYLVNPNGEVVQYFTQLDTFKSIKQSIQYLLEKSIEL